MTTNQAKLESTLLRFLHFVGLTNLSNTEIEAFTTLPTRPSFPLFFPWKLTLALTIPPLILFTGLVILSTNIMALRRDILVLNERYARNEEIYTKSAQALEELREERGRDAALSTKKLLFFSSTNLALSIDAGGGMWSWDIDKHQPVHRLGLFLSVQEPILALPEAGAYVLAVDNATGEVALCDGQSGRTLTRLRPSEAVYGLALSPDHRYAALGYANSAALWDLMSRKEIRTFDTANVGKFLGTPTKMAFSFDGRRLATVGDRNPGVVLWDVMSGRKLQSMVFENVLGGPITCLTFSPNGRYVLAGDGVGITVLDRDRGDVRRFRDPGHTPRRPSSIAVSPDGMTVLAGGKDGLEAWEFETGELRRTYSAPSIDQVAFLRGDLAKTADRDLAIRVWALREEYRYETVFRLPGPASTNFRLD